MVVTSEHDLRLRLQPFALHNTHLCYCTYTYQAKACISLLLKWQGVWWLCVQGLSELGLVHHKQYLWHRVCSDKTLQCMTYRCLFVTIHGVLASLSFSTLLQSRSFCIRQTGLVAATCIKQYTPLGKQALPCKTCWRVGCTLPRGFGAALRLRSKRGGILCCYCCETIARVESVEYFNQCR